jgi:uncharacterized protein YecE (DUF72 family)
VSTLRIGTSGWNYPSGPGTWNGVFYPPRTRRPKGFDELAFYAEHFDTVEVNSTFYGMPRAEVTAGWAARTPAGFEFSVKLHQKFTHPRMFTEMLQRSLKLPDADASALQELARPNDADLHEFKEGIAPLVDRGKLGALLVQFPPSFKNDPLQRAYLASLLSAFDDYQTAVELRHKSWSDDLDDTLGILNTFSAAWVQIDEPKFRTSIRQNFLPNVKGFYYMRLHGRNAAQWWHHEKSEDRYDYLYSEGELEEFTGTLKAAKQLVKKAYLYTNNHHSAKSVANAAMIRRQIGEPLTGEYTPEFIERYPELAGVLTPIPSDRLV